MNNLLNIRSDFDVLNNNKDLVYLDSSATSLKPKCVVDKINEYYNNYGVNVNRGVYQLSYKATEEYEETRGIVAAFLNASEEEIVFTKGASNGLNMIAASYGMDNISEGDEIITSELEHHSSLLPWIRVAEKKNAKIVYVPLDKDGRITVENFKKVLTNKTKVVALTHISNVMGYITPIEEIIVQAHEVGAIVIVDGAQSVPHIKIDVKKMDCDFFIFSAHKMLGPTGFGIIYGKKKILKKMRPIEYGGDMIESVSKDKVIYKPSPYCFETGTPAIAEGIAFKESIKYLNNIGMDKVQEHEKILHEYALDKLSKIEGITIYNPKADIGIITFNINRIHPHDSSMIFDENNVCLRAGHHCAELLSRWIGINGTLRASIYIYNNYEDIDRFIEAVKQAVEMFKEW